MQWFHLEPISLSRYGENISSFCYLCCYAPCIINCQSLLLQINRVQPPDYTHSAWIGSWPGGALCLWISLFTQLPLSLLPSQSQLPEMCYCGKWWHSSKQVTGFENRWLRHCYQVSCSHRGEEEVFYNYFPTICSRGLQHLWPCQIPVSLAQYASHKRLRLELEGMADVGLLLKTAASCFILFRFRSSN